MANNASVTAGGAEIAHAQWVQALAAGVPAEPAMNPVLLKPTTERSSQVVVMGRPLGTWPAGTYQSRKRALDRKSTRLNSSHANISYAVFCLKHTACPALYTLSLHDALPISGGAEIAHAQWVQALAAGVPAEPAMNPVLLKPTTERSSQVVVMGRPLGTWPAGTYQSRKRA